MSRDLQCVERGEVLKARKPHTAKEADRYYGHKPKPSLFAELDRYLSQPIGPASAELVRQLREKQR